MQVWSAIKGFFVNLYNKLFSPTPAPKALDKTELAPAFKLELTPTPAASEAEPVASIEAQAVLPPKQDAINARAGRYFIFIDDSSRVIVEATPADIAALYRKLCDPREIKSYVGYGWISPDDYRNNPVTGTVDTFK